MNTAFNLRIAAEERIGSVISDEEYLLTLSEARQKLKRINNRYGMQHGETYLAMLVAEAVRARRLTRYLNGINDLRDQARS